MKIQVFKNNKGLIYGNDADRISSDISGTLKIGTAEIPISADAEMVMPVLFNGCTGSYKATFTSVLGHEYELEKVSVKGGRLVPPSQTSVELMELRCRVEALEADNESIREELLKLSNIFDTDALNFLLK
jgi:hypothetical protein